MKLVTTLYQGLLIVERVMKTYDPVRMDCDSNVLTAEGMF